MRVSESNRPTSDASARRFAVFATEQMLRRGEKGVHQVAFIERAFYELALRDKLSCTEVDEETRTLKLNLEPSTYADKCVNRRMRELYASMRGKLLEESRDDSKSKSRIRKRRYDRARRVRAARNRSGGA